jgi:hypothetical protein
MDKMKTKKYYIAYYEYVYSISSKENFIKYLEDIVSGTAKKEIEYGFRPLKKKCSREKEYLVGKNYVEVYHLLDWTKEEYQNLLNELRG